MSAPSVTAAPPQLGSRIPGLDGIRGVAILLVLAGHVIQNLPTLPATTRLWLAGFANSSAGVRLFFVLSGYLITMLLAQEWDRSGTISIRRFYWRRIVRIFPAFYVFLVVVALLVGMGICAGTPSALAAAGTFTWNYAILWLHVSPAQQWTFGHLWTLALEQQFYLLWPLLLWSVGRKRAVYWAVGIALWCPIARVATYYLIPPWRGYVGIMLHTAIDSIIIGCAAALVVRNFAVHKAIEQRARQFGATAIIWLFFVSPVVGITIRGFPIVAGFTTDALAAAVLIMVVHTADKTAVARFFKHRALTGIGVISYSWYLWQQLFLAPTKIHTFLDGIRGILLSGAVATASYLVIERPVLKWGRTVRSKRHINAVNHVGTG